MKLISAIIRRSALAGVEERITKEGVMGITVTPVKGFGEYRNYFGGGDALVDHVKLEVFAFDQTAPQIAEAIMKSVHSGVAGDGLLALFPVEKIYKIRTGREAEILGQGGHLR